MRGRERRAGLARGPRARALGGRRARWGWLGREAEQAWAAARLPPFFSFSVFFFSSLFEFKFGFGI